MSKIFIRTIGKADGFPVHEAWDEAVQGPTPDGAVVIPRLPEAFEKWVDGAWVVPANAVKARADWSVPAEHIAAVHMQKRIEAALIKGGKVLDGGLLAPEAEQRGISQEEMAEIIEVKAADFYATEVKRQKA